MKIGLDLDNCVFDAEPLYKQAFTRTEYKYYPPKNYWIGEAYPKPVADNLYKIFRSEAVLWTKPFDFKLPGLINLISTNPQHEVHVITARELPNAKDGTINQLRRNGIYIPNENIHITDFDKVQLAKFLKLDVIFDDSPIVIQNCLDNNIPCVMISTPVTPYNHHLRNKVEHYTSLYKALQQKVK
jgi:hypothetical protein